MVNLRQKTHDVSEDTLTTIKKMTEDLYAETQKRLTGVTSLNETRADMALKSLLYPLQNMRVLLNTELGIPTDQFGNETPVGEALRPKT